MLVHEREQFLVVLPYLHVTTSLVALTIYSIKFLVFNFLGCNFLAPKSGDLNENQLVLAKKSL